MITDASLIETVLFWCLVILVLLPFPLTWSIFGYLLIAHLDMSGPTWASASSMGWENMLKILVLPTVLWLRTRPRCWGFIKTSKTFRIWMAFMLYTAIASLWSSFPLSAAKLIGYLYGHTVTFLVLVEAWCSIGRVRMYRIVLISLGVSLLFAIIQTYFLGNPFGTSEGRFTSFSSPQSFAAYLVCALAIGLLGSEHGAKGILTGSLGTVIIAIPLLLTGSNTMLLGMGAVVMYWIVIRTVAKPSYAHLTQFHLVCLIAGVLCLTFFLYPDLLHISRATNFIYAVVSKDMRLSDIGTFAWRISIYRTITQVLGQSGIMAILFGHGTSNGANLMVHYLGGYEAVTIDANRVLHNEWLRIIYEWGLLGVALFCSFLASLFVVAIKRLRSPFSWPFLSIVPMLLGLLTVENVLASSGTPEGIGLMLVIAEMACCVKGPNRVRCLL